MPNSTYCACGCGTSIATRRTDGKPKRFAHGHNMRGAPRPFTEGTADECWEWQWNRRDAGYGVKVVITADGKTTSTPAHRWVYGQRVGPIPAGMELDHLCNNRGCVNPAHLRVVTRTENMRRASTTKLDLASAREIRRRFGRFTARQLAEQFGVSVSTVYLVLSGKVWAESDG